MKFTQHPLSAAIYQIKNLQNGRVYVGSSVNLKKRWREHKNDLKKGTHHSQKLQNAWNKYGEESFEFSILEAVFDKAKLLEQEQHWIDLLCAANRVNYNISISATSPMLGRSPSIETRAKLAEAMRGNTHCVGVLHSPEARERMGAAKRGQQRTVEQRGRMSAAQIGNSNKLGFVVSEETRLKLSASKIGNKSGAGNKGPVGNQNRKGIPHTEETKRLMSEKRKANFLKKQGAQA